MLNDQDTTEEAKGGVLVPPNINIYYKSYSN